MWLSIGIDYQYQSIDKLITIGCGLTEPELTHKKHNFVRSNCKHISILNTQYSLLCLFKTLTHHPQESIMTRKGNDGQVRNSSKRATGYILCVEKTGSEFVLPISSPGLPKNGR